MKKPKPAAGHLHRKAQSRTHKHHQVKRALRAKRSPFKKVLMHPTSLFAVLVVGVLLVGLTLRAVADNVVVTGVIHAPLLANPATITSPVNGQIIGQSPVTVTGTCPSNSYVKVFRNAQFAGVAICETNNTYSVKISLVVGTNTLVVQDYNVTDDVGPVTPGITVYYQPSPLSPDASTGQVNDTNSGAVGATGINSSIDTPLLIWADYHFAVVKRGQAFTWKASIEGGARPYQLHIDWGDAQVGDRTVDHTAPFDMSHTYTKTGYYKILLTARDTKNRVSVMQLVALVKNPGSSGTIGAIMAPPNPPEQSFWQIHHWLLLAWPTYLIIILMTLTFWLGERREYILLMQRKRPLRYPRHA